MWTIKARSKQDKSLIMLKASNRNKKAYALRLLENRQEKQKGK